MKLNNFFTPNVRDGWFGSVFFYMSHGGETRLDPADLKSAAVKHPSSNLGRGT